MVVIFCLLVSLRRVAGTAMGKTRKSFYAVRVGREVGVYSTWAECQAQVNGYPGAVFKGFSDAVEAQAFVNSSQATRAKTTYSSRCSYKPSRSSFSRMQEHHSRRRRDGGSSITYSRRMSTLNGYSYGSGSSRAATVAPVQPTSHGYCIKTVALQHGKTANEQGHPTVYSDGCCFNNGRTDARAGIGVFWGNNSPHNISEKLCGSQTNQRAELVSACRAIQSAIDQGYSAVEVKTDSSYTIKVMTEWVSKWKENGWVTSQATPVKNKDDITQLDSACQKINVKWTHVPGHSAIAGNEAADKLAKAGALK